MRGTWCTTFPWLAVIIFILFSVCFQLGNASITLKDRFASGAREFIDEFNKEFGELRNVEAEAAWNASVKITPENQDLLGDIQDFKETWRKEWCGQARYWASKPQWLDDLDLKQLLLMCRGPEYSPQQSSAFDKAQHRLYEIYHTTEVCFERRANRALVCEHGEPELARRFQFERDPRLLLSLWIGWHDGVGRGPEGKGLYRDMVRIMNEASRQSGYKDTSEAWKEQLGIENVDQVIDDLFGAIFPLYQKLHAFVRHRLSLFYGSESVSSSDPIPAHLLGNLWGQSWGALMDLLVPEESTPYISLTERIRARNLTVMDIVDSADNFYQSMGLPAMTATFWEKSQLTRPWQQHEPTSCHSSALDMYHGGDFRIEMCGDSDEETFNAVYHEMGHVQYYMAYAKLPPILRDGPSPVFHEAVGDCMVYAANSKDQLNRLGLSLQDDEELQRLLHLALDRIPLIAWSLVVDRWRWDVFSGKVKEHQYNHHWWKLRRQIQGIVPPIPRDESRFDPLAKFHIADNTPYMPYFFSGFLQVQFFKGLCTSNGNHQPLYLCDLFGNKEAGSKMRSMMEFGQSIDWKEALEIVTHETEYSAKPLLEYFQPLDKWLTKVIEEEQIILGWN